MLAGAGQGRGITTVTIDLSTHSPDPLATGIFFQKANNRRGGHWMLVIVDGHHVKYVRLNAEPGDREEAEQEAQQVATEKGARWRQ